LNNCCHSRKYFRP